MKLVFEYNSTVEGDVLSTVIQANGFLFADRDIKRGCYEIIKNAALYIDVPTSTAILNLLGAIDSKQNSR